MSTYYFILASHDFLFKEEPVEEILRERINHYNSIDKEIDFWLVTDQKFLSESQYFQFQLTKPSAAIISSNKNFIEWIKLRLGFVQIGHFEIQENLITTITQQSII